MKKTAYKESNPRSGIAAIEFAVVAPVIVAIFLGSISAMAQISLRRNLQLVAYSAAAEVSDTSNDLAAVEAHFENFAMDLGVRGMDLTITVHEDRIYLIKATAPQTGNNPIPPPSATSNALTARCYVYR